jgi:hypothetical protein
MLSARIKMWGALSLGVMALLAGCGSSSNNAAPATTTISGSVYAAPVSGATVTIKDGNGNVLAANVHTGSNGTYSESIPSSTVSGTLIFESGGGTYSDEATGATTTAGLLAAYVPAGSLSAGASVNLDPASTIVAGLVALGKPHADAKTSFASAFGFTPECTVGPINAPYSASSTTAQRLAALRAMAFSKLTKDLGQGPDKQFNLLNALANDLNDDGILNGSFLVSIGTTTLPEDIQNRFESALVSMLSNTAVNTTGLTTADIGSLPFGKVILTNTYKVEYLPGMMAAAMGKTSFKIKISKRSDGSPATGLSLSLMPKMYMATMSHMTPVDGTITESAPGTYSCTVYYLMASGPGMGYWELKVQIGGMMGETATFYPAVGMAMGSTTVRATLKGQSDLIGSMISTSNRTYYLFRDGLVSGTTSTFNLFIAAQESMMSFPALSTLSTTTLHDQSGTPWTVSSVTVLASTDGSTWSSPAAETATGHWSLSGLSGLVSGQTGTIYIKLNVNVEDKTTDGNAASGANSYAVFTVTP